MIKKNRVIISLMLIAALVSSVPVAYAQPAGAVGIVDYSLENIKDSWDELPDELLNDYIGNNNDSDIYVFIAGLSEEERKELLSRETMLNNEVSIDKGDGGFEQMPYYDWIIKNGGTAAPMMYGARSINSTFTAKSGYCFFRFVDDDSGYVVRYKVTMTLNSTANAESTTNGFTVASVIYGTSGTNSNNTGLDQVTFAKQKQYMQKANTVHEVLGDGTSSKNADGDTIYRTAITPIFVLTVKVKKPPYTYGEWNTEGFTSGGEAQKLTKGSRFNFEEYNWTNTGDTTFDNKVYHDEVTDTLTSCVNILSCGFTVDNTGSLGLAEGVPDNDTINVVYKHPELKVKFYANGGSVSKTTNNPDGETPVERTVEYNKKYNATYGLPEADTFGFSKEGNTPIAGKEWKNAENTWSASDKSYVATDLMDFTDGTYFKTKTKSLYVNWDPNVYEVILDNQGAQYSGTEKTWYKYNTTQKITLSDGTEQINYYYTTKALATPLEKGYKIVKPEKTGYTFKGYYSGKNGTGTQYVKENGAFTNSLYKTIGPHTLYAYWDKNDKTGLLTIRRDLKTSDFYSSHGDATFLFKISSKSDPAKVYYRSISFSEEDMKSANNGLATKETSCRLPYGEYTVKPVEVYRFDHQLSSISSGSKVSSVEAAFGLNENCEAVTVVYGGARTNWAKFSHNDLQINSLS